MKRRVVVVGSVNMDLILRCEHLPLPGQTVHGSDFRTLPGGKGANQAVAAARMGALVSFIGCVGEDAFGRLARETLQAEGIDVSALHRVPGATGVAMIQVEASGQNAITLASGANDALAPVHIEQSGEQIAAAAMLICQLESPLPVVGRAIALARAAGVPVLLNPAPARPLPAELLAQIDLLVPNESEAAALLGLAPGAALDAPAAASRLRERGPATVIVTLGGRGAQLADEAGARYFPAPRVTATDTTGAGDTFIGAFAAARSEGVPVDGAVALAQRAAALSVTRAGAMAAMPYRYELGPAAGWSGD